MNSWAAKSNGYTWVGRKEHYGTAYYHSVLFVRADSPIQSIADIKTATRVALGYIGSASSFYFPVYDLYGKSLSVTRDNPHEKIKDLVNKRQAHVGATMESFVSNEPGLRIIHRSRAIPVAGVFISPKLSESERIHIQKALIEAPPTIQEIANYRESPEINYDYIGQMSLKTEEVIGCANFNKNPVQLFCPK
jgi:serine/threonine-protein kinase